MTTLTLRSTNGAPLTHQEVDDNFTNLDNEFANYLPLSGGNITGDIDTTHEINLADDEVVAWGGGTSRPSIKGNKTDGTMDFFVAGSSRVEFTSTTATFNLGDLQVNNKISHNGDANNYLSFGTDKLTARHNGSIVWESTTSGLDVTGVITVDGTVDGRDIATDGTKLDTIDSDADKTVTANVVGALTAGTNITIASNGTISSAAAYTDADARTAISVTNPSGDGTLAYNNTTGVITYTGPSASEVRAHLSAGTGMSYNSTSGQFSSSITQYTDALARGAISVSGDLAYNSTTGQISYNAPTMYADADARTAISVTNPSGDGDLAYNSTTGVITYTGPSASEVRAHLSAGTGISYNSTSGQFSSSYTVTDGELSENNFTDALKDKLDSAVVSDNEINSTETQVAHIQVLSAVEFLTNKGSGTLDSDTIYLVAE